MENITIILVNQDNSRMSDICFNAPKGMLSINGQSLIERLCLQFMSFSKYIIIVAGHNIRAFQYLEKTISNVKIIGNIDHNHISNSESLYLGLDEIDEESDSITIVEGDIILSNSAFEKYKNINSSKKFVISNTVLKDKDDKVIYDTLKHIYFLDKCTKKYENNQSVKILGKYLGIITLPFNIINEIKRKLTNNINVAYIDTLQEFLDDSYNTIFLEEKDGCEIDTSDDYYNALTNPNIARIPCRYKFKTDLEFSNNFKKYVGIYDVAGGLMAQHCGFDGLWLGSYQICVSNGIKDDETYNPMIALHLAKKLKKQLVELPVIIDIGSGFFTNYDLANFSDECKNTNVVAVCIDDNKNHRINSMFTYSNRQVLTNEEFQERLHDLREYLPSNIKIIARTELITIYKEKIDFDILNKRIKSLQTKDVDAILPHYVGNNFEFISNILSKIVSSKPIILIPTGLINIKQRCFYDLGVNLIIYANLDIRSRFNSVNNTYLSIITSGALDDSKKSSLSSPIEIQNYIDSML